MEGSILDLEYKKRDSEEKKNETLNIDKRIKELNLNNEWELHLMVNHPLKEIEKWKTVKNIKRVIFHIECEDRPSATIKAIKESGWEVAIAINPETDKYDVLPYISQIDEILFMTVHPGRQGAPFVEEVQDNIIELKKILEIKHADIIIAADGSIKKDNIQKIKSWGVNNFCVGSAIISAPDPKSAYEELLKLI